MLKLKISKDYVLVPSKMIRDVLPTTNPTFIKVYLYIMMLATDGLEIDITNVADKLQLLESDVNQAVRYWQNAGVLEVVEEESISPQINLIPDVNSEEARRATDYSVDEINNKISSDSRLIEMMQVAESVMGRMFTQSEMKTLYWMYDELHFLPEVILMLLEYCASMGKKNISYIEKIALDWDKKGLNTIDTVSQYIAKANDDTTYFTNLKKIFGIYDRDFSDLETTYLNKWKNDYKMPEEMVALAYEYSIIKTGKFTFPYADGIITNWVKKNIFTIAEAEKDKEDHKLKSKKGEAGGEHSIDELADLSWGKLD